MTSWNRVEIDLAALRHNFRQLRELAGPATGIMAMVKADAYGHGLIQAARAFAQAGAVTFGVAELEEGIRLRQAGIEGEIVVLLGIDRQGAAEAVANNLTPVVYDRDCLEEFAAQAVMAGCRRGVQLKVDTGMGRLGVLPGEFSALAAALNGLPSLYLAGVLSHLPKADMEGDESAPAQQARFLELLAEAGLAGNHPVRHIVNSAGLLRYPELRAEMVRPGITLYGCYPAGWLKGEAALKLKPAMRFVSRVIQVKDIPAGQGISYGHRFVTNRPTRLAVLPVGYADGYLRRLCGKAEVLLGGKRAPVRGMICMNACMADVTDIDGVGPGDEVVILGRQGEEEIGADELAAWSDSITYEIFCLFGSCNQRIHLKEEE